MKQIQIHKNQKKETFVMREKWQTEIDERQKNMNLLTNNIEGIHSKTVL